MIPGTSSSLTVTVTVPSLLAATLKLASALVVECAMVNVSSPSVDSSSMDVIAIIFGTFHAPGSNVSDVGWAVISAEKLAPPKMCTVTAANGMLVSTAV